MVMLPQVGGSSPESMRSAVVLPAPFGPTARAANRRFWLVSTLRVHRKEPSKTDVLWETLRPLQRPARARAESEALVLRDAEREVRDGDLRTQFGPPGMLHGAKYFGWNSY